MNDLVDLRIEDATPHILRRPILYVEPDTRMLQVATFLAIGPEIYVDGLLVMEDNVQRGRPIGRISSRHIISSILDFGYPDAKKCITDDGWRCNAFRNRFFLKKSIGSL
jgi:hypothetical protein